MAILAAVSGAKILSAWLPRFEFGHLLLRWGSSKLPGPEILVLARMGHTGQHDCHSGILRREVHLHQRMARMELLADRRREQLA